MAKEDKPNTPAPPQAVADFSTPVQGRNTSPAQTIITTKQAADRLGVTSTTVHDLCAAGFLRAEFLEKRRAVFVDSVAALIDFLKSQHPAG
jgi:hypothetical protein